jgi:hypothetical protein
MRHPHLDEGAAFISLANSNEMSGGFCKSRAAALDNAHLIAVGRIRIRRRND